MEQRQDRRTELGRQRRARTRAAIIAAAFDIFGEENGLHARIEDIVEKAGVTRATFYNHFENMIELREALSHEVTHDFLEAVTRSIGGIADARERSAAALRFYLRRARHDRRWGWSMMNMSASGAIFGAETYRQAERTIREGMEDGVFPITSSELGRDILMGATLAAMGSIVRFEMADDYPEAVASHILCGLGVERALARTFANMPLPPLQD